MKKLLLGLLLTSGFIAQAQYNNEWIDYSKTYYKFKVGKTGLYRISQSVLSAAGLGSTAAENFQLWRNGKQIPIYTSVATGPLSASDYIEFWGEMNDGKPDKELYRDTRWQLNDKWSLETDTAAFFLTVNPDISSNLRQQTTANNVAGTSLSVDPYFMYTAGQYFRDRINPGYAVYVGQYLYSSSYDKGEGWSSSPITTTYNAVCTPTYGHSSFVFKNLNVYKGASAPAPKFTIAVSGNLINQRRYQANINSDSVINNAVDFFNYVIDSAAFSINSLNSSSDTVTVFNYSGSYAVGCPPNDQIVIHRCEITYPRDFNFNGATNFAFSLAANPVGNYLQITNFNYGTSVPVLYDLTNNQRYVADLSAAPLLKFVLAPSLTTRNLVLVSEEPANINAVSAMQARNFVDYTATGNQGDYLIISHPSLFNGNGSNPVDDYRAYRSSAAGGSYNAKIYLIDEIIDQFGFGIKKNPAAVRNFIRYARNNYTTTPKDVFIIGRGMVYTEQRAYESFPDVDKLNLVPTYGSPASDVLLGADPGSSLTLTSIGRLSAVTPDEVAVYLKKVKEYEQVQATASPLIKDKGWMKNFVHIVGASDDALDSLLTGYLNQYKAIITDTLFGGKVSTFNKTTVDAVAQLSNTAMSQLFEQGISVITYFGHSSATTLEFNLDNPQNYNNYQKYPLFIAMGCNAGAFFNYSPTRLFLKETISENDVLAPDRGVIGFVASTHFGIPYYLNVWAQKAYRQMAYKNYGSTIGEILKATAADVFAAQSQEDFYARCNTEQTEYNGDPVIRLNPHAKPDYAIEDSMVKISPSFVSVADHSFKVNANFLNIGKSPDSSVVLEIKRQLPDGSVIIVRRDTVPGIRYAASMVDTIPIKNPAKEKGLNKIIVTVDPDNNIDELFEDNNSITKDVMIFEEEIRPIYPYNYAIINQQNIKLSASTANPFDSAKQYIMELDTTALFNSSFKVTKTVTSPGGLIQFDPGVSFTDHTVYYWRTAPAAVNGNLKWNTASFIYIANGQDGFNQSHFYQHANSTTSGITLDSASRKWNFDSTTNNLFIRNGVFPTAASTATDFAISVNGDDSYIRSVCGLPNIIVNVFNPFSFKPWFNALTGDPTQYGSDPTCGDDRAYNFQFTTSDTVKRRKLMEFLDLIPDGYFVVVRNTAGSNYTPNTYAPDWLKDTANLGPGNSIYHRLYNQGFSTIDSFNRPRAWIFAYQKNNQQNVAPQSVFSEGIYDRISLSVNYKTPDSIGYITSPVFGPMKSWKELRWTGATTDASAGDAPSVNLIGIGVDGTTTVLMNNIDITRPVVDISSVDAARYPYLQLQMRNADSVHFTAFQLNNWQLTGVAAPEGAINPSQFFAMKDTLDVGEPLKFQAAFKNVSEYAFSDSVKVKVIITNKNGSTITLPAWKQRILAASPDTINVTSSIITKQLTGNNTLYVEVNPDYDQPELYHFNNFFYRNFYVRPDTLNPLLDVTFDNVHILNHDIVSSKPNILVKLTDDSKWFLIDNSSSLKVKVQYPDGSMHPYNFGTDTLQFVPAVQQTPTTNNTASAIFKPYFPVDGEYQLIISGNDMSQNKAGNMEYRVSFDVYNKPMISNMLNYPNPFTTSTAFVFTLTGAEVPQNIKIEIMTVTGKIVREITKDELGPLHIGRNITEFKWDGTDQFGQKLANGVYLYRVVTNLDGKPLDKYTSKDDHTDKYFNKGYGKMYLMR